MEEERREEARAEGASPVLTQREALEEALNYYPFELSSALRLLSEAASTAACSDDPINVLGVLESLRRMTMMVPQDFNAYALENEEEGANQVVLTEDVPTLISKQEISFYGSRRVLFNGNEDRKTSALLIPAGTSGIVIKETKPMAICLQHEHSGLEYLGVLLSTLLPTSALAVVSPNPGLDRSTAAEIVTLIAVLLRSCLQQQDTVDQAPYILGRLGFALQDEQDIVSIITEIFETELLAHLDQSMQEGSLGLLIACVDFFDGLITLAPERVWSIIMRSSLLGITNGASSLASVVGGTEVQMGHYSFLMGCAQIYYRLVDDAIAGMVRRKGRRKTSLNRFDSGTSYQDTTSERTAITVLGAYHTVMIDAWQNINEWPFFLPVEKLDLTTVMIWTFETILKTTYGIDTFKKDDDGEKIPKSIYSIETSKTGNEKLSGLLAASGTAVLNAFAPENGQNASLHPFGDILASGMMAQDEELSEMQRASAKRQTDATLSFLTCLVRTARMGEKTEQRAHHLSFQLLESTPLLVKLFVSGRTFKGGVSDLLAELVQAVSIKSESDPPSLLGRLGTEDTLAFLDEISKLNSTTDEVETEASIWNFLSAAISSKQQWFTVYLLTGTLPRDRMKDASKSKSTKDKSLLAHALDKLCNIDEESPERAMAMLKFIATAQNFWVWATNEVRSHPKFLTKTLEWLNKLQSPSKVPSVAQQVLLANEHQLAAYLCDILAVTLHASLEIGDQSVINTLQSKLEFLRSHGVKVNAYNRSLHMNLAENFARKFPACEIKDFLRTSANPAPFGRDYCYDLSLANTVLDFDSAWGRHQGFSDEVARANTNLSLVEGQKRLLRSWSVLATTLCECPEPDSTLQSELAQTAERCLGANFDVKLDQPGMDEVVKSRAQMAFLVISKLVVVNSSHSSMKALLRSAWDLVRSSPANYDVATSHEDLSYYRLLLQILYLSLQPHIYMDTKPPPNATNETRIEFLSPDTASILLEITTKLIAPAFRALCGNLHSSLDLAQPGDFALLTAIIQSLLAIRGVSAIHTQIADIVASTSLVRGALSLYSWSDQLAEQTNHDPLYAELALNFLLTLSGVRPVAEHMALEGVLVQISSANLSSYYQKPGGKGPFDEPGRMFNIWADGILPLCLNLLDAVGPALSAEVTNFLNSFPEQLRRASAAFENREPSRHNPYAGLMTLGVITEAHSLSLLSVILASDVARGAADGINPADVPQLEYDFERIKEEQGGVEGKRLGVESRVVPVSEREREWALEGADGKSLLAKKAAVALEGVQEVLGE